MMELSTSAPDASSPPSPQRTPPSSPPSRTETAPPAPAPPHPAAPAHHHHSADHPHRQPTPINYRRPADTFFASHSISIFHDQQPLQNPTPNSHTASPLLLAPSLLGCLKSNPDHTPANLWCGCVVGVARKA